MSASTIDTLAVSQTLRRHGFSEEQAIGVVTALREIDASELAMKGDIREVEAKIEKVEARIEAAAANLKVDILRWLVVTQPILNFRSNARVPVRTFCDCYAGLHVSSLSHEEFSAWQATGQVPAKLRSEENLADMRTKCATLLGP